MMAVQFLTRKMHFAETIKSRLWSLRFFFFGLLFPLGFAPFHWPGVAIISLALLYYQLQQSGRSHAALHGFAFGCGVFSLGVSWIFVSIHEYGHLNLLISLLVTLLFIAYLSLFPALMAFCFSRMPVKPLSLSSGLVFSALWVLNEYLRSTLLTGFPWLLLGVGQFDAPSRYLLPIIGIYGVGLVTCFAATLLAMSVTKANRLIYFVMVVTLLLLPNLMQYKQWGETSTRPVSIGIIQANMSMRDKWDESLLWALLQRYKHDTQQLLGTELIVMPESAIPLPPSYITDFIEELHQSATQANSSILLGTLLAAPHSDHYFNAITVLGRGEGTYLKQHLVPFGEYTPAPFTWITHWLQVPDGDLEAGKSQQHLINIQNHAIASLICYEVAYGSLLRAQLPQAEWIVSISDDGWFGHSLALYQHQQMAQALSLQTARYQILANNDGLSSVINNEGEIIASLPAFSSGLLRSFIYPMQGNTPWVYYGDWPILVFSALICLFCFFIRHFWHKETLEIVAAEAKRGYPYQPV